MSTVSKMTKEVNSDSIAVETAAAEDSTKGTSDDIAPTANAAVTTVENETVVVVPVVTNEDSTVGIKSQEGTFIACEGNVKTDATMNEPNVMNNNIPVADAELTANFPQKLTEILTNEEYAEIIHWLPHGKGFMIADKKRFADEVLPKYFKKAKFTSFTRKLNRWNFVRITRGPEVGSYYHPNFQKDSMKLVSQMTCIGSKQPQAVQPLDPIALGVVPMGEAVDATSETLSGVQQWQRQDHERYRLFYQQNHWNYMMQMMQQAASATSTQEPGTTDVVATEATGEPLFPVKEELATDADDDTKDVKISTNTTVSDPSCDPSTKTAEL